MGGRGTFAAGNIVPYQYRTAGHINGIPVLERLDGKRKLPEEAHASRAYILLKAKNGIFHEMRFYDENHNLVKEIAYHHESKINKEKKYVLHVHEYPEPGNFATRTTREITKEEYLKFKHFFKGVPEFERCK